MADLSIGFIGAGRMATALAGGWVKAGLVTTDRLFASDPSLAAGETFAAATGGLLLADNTQVANRADLLVLAVKPQQMTEVLAGLRGHVVAKHLVVSIAAGIRLAKLEEGLGAGPRLVRVMPNTPCLIGEGASAYCLGPGATSADGQLVNQLLSAVGRACEVSETLLDAVTGLSGSGPAFVFSMIEALTDGGEKVGLARDVAQMLATQTVLGAAKMVLTTGQQPAALREQVTSPNGTTLAGLKALEAHGFRATVMAAVEAATQRSVELGRSG